MKTRYIVLALGVVIAGWLVWSGDPQPELVAATNSKVRAVVSAHAAVTEPRAETAILVLRQREQLLGAAQTDRPAGDLFHAPMRLPAPGAAVVVAATTVVAPPTAPPLTFSYIGKKMEAGVWEVYLARDQQTFIVHEQMTLDYNYRVDTISPTTMTLTYLPLKQQQTLTIGSSQ